MPYAQSSGEESKRNIENRYFNYGTLGGKVEGKYLAVLLAKLLSKQPSIERLHLVGHSMGGGSTLLFLGNLAENKYDDLLRDLGYGNTAERLKTILNTQNSSCILFAPMLSLKESLKTFLGSQKTGSLLLTSLIAP
jgi:pimeloyl-ACP methyl ester carboxylesterase